MIARGANTGVVTLANTGNLRSTFTLPKLIVVIGVIGMLLGLLIPVVREVLEAADRARCANPLGPLGLALIRRHGKMLAAAIASLIWSGGLAACQSDAPEVITKERICALIDEYVSRLGQYQLTTRSTFRYEGGAILPNGIDVHTLLHSGESSLVRITQAGNSDYEDQLAGCNPDYSFRIGKRKLTDNWTMLETGDGRIRPKMVTPFRERDGLLFVARDMSPFGIGSLWLPDILTDPKYQATLSKMVGAPDQERVKVKFVYPDLGSGNSKSGSAVIQVTPTIQLESWKTDSRRGQARLVTTSRAVYQEPKNGMALMRQAVVVYRASGATAAPPTEMTVDYDYAKKSVEESSLRMSAFGFPEPRTAATRHGSRYFWVLVGTLALILMVLVCRRAAGGRCKLGDTAAQS